MGSLARIYLRLVGARIRSQMQYRLSFVLQLVSDFGVAVVDFLAITVFFQHLRLLGGWSFGEVAFLLGSSYVSFRITDLAIGHLDDLPAYVRTGQFDAFLIRPLGALFQVATADFQLRRLGSIASGSAIFMFALSKVAIDWDPGRLVVLALMLASGAVIFGAVWLATNTIAFYVAGGRESANAFTYGGQFFAQFPIHIFGRWLRRLLTFLIPVAFVNYFPSLYILGKPDPLGGASFLRFASPLVAAAAAIAGWLIWRTGVRHYRSTGS